MDWTEEEKATLLELWREGLAARQIGVKMGRTKNAILGMLHRIRGDKGVDTAHKRNPHGVVVAGHVNGYKRPAVPKAKAMVVKVVKPMTASQIQKKAALGLKPLGSSALPDRGCCGYISGDPWRACNRPAVGSWCTAHAAVVFNRQVA